MPIEIFIAISKAFIKKYCDKNHNLSSQLMADVCEALIPICDRCEKGEYYIKPGHND